MQFSVAGRKAVPVARLGPEFRSRRKEFAMARRQKTLLCVDDNQSSLNICKIILEDFGYKVSTASSGATLASSAVRQASTASI